VATVRCPRLGTPITPSLTSSDGVRETAIGESAGPYSEAGACSAIDNVADVDPVESGCLSP
jgi:hypothetical protein